ncbi:MAG: hypothetical protein WC631_00165 [Candidatus Paceibacterota bacterium]|jgi:hypothetical protein
MIRIVVRFFDRLEDRVRGRLSHRSIIYGFIGGMSLVLFWRGVWHTGDILMEKGGILGWLFYEPHTIVWTSIILLMTGLFVSLTIGDRIILSGIKHEKKVEEKTESEIKGEESEIQQLNKKVEGLYREISEIKDLLKK